MSAFTQTHDVWSLFLHQIDQHKNNTSNTLGEIIYTNTVIIGNSHSLLDWSRLPQHLPR